MSHSEVVEKVRETGGSWMIIGEILCLFDYIACPLFLLHLVWWIQLQIDESGEGRCQGWELYSIY